MLVEQGENARLSKRLATIQLDCPVQFEPEQFRARSPHTDELVGLLRELEFMTLAKTFQPTAPQDTFARWRCRDQPARRGRGDTLCALIVG